MEEAHAIALLDARLDEVKRFAAVLNRHQRLNGANALHYDNRVQAIEVERARLMKAAEQKQKLNQKLTKK